MLKSSRGFDTLQEAAARHKTSEHLSTLIRQLEDCVSAEIDETGFRSRRALSEELNQMMRGLRQCRSTEEVAGWLVDSTAPFCGRAALFEVMRTRVRGVRSRGFQMAAPQVFAELEISADDAPAFVHSIQERETVVAMGTPAQVSEPIASALSHAPGEKVYLYPIVIQDEVVAILYATAGERQTVDGAALELLAHAAAGAAQVLSGEQSAAARQGKPGLIKIQGAGKPAVASAAASDFRRQAIEARASWFARTEAARLRLFHAAALARGRSERNIYGALKPRIDAARLAYRQDFLAVSPVIADYLHKELLDLAHEDPNLLGPEYPGSLV